MFAAGDPASTVSVPARSTSKIMSASLRQRFARKASHAPRRTKRSSTETISCPYVIFKIVAAAYLRHVSSLSFARCFHAPSKVVDKVGRGVAQALEEHERLLFLQRPQGRDRALIEGLVDESAVLAESRPTVDWSAQFDAIGVSVLSQMSRRAAPSHATAKM